MPEKLCIFCKKHPCDSGEHIVSDWILRYCGMGQQNCIIGFGRENVKGEMDHVTEMQLFDLLKARVVCNKCNTQWMSRMENKARQLLAPLLEDDLPINLETTLRNLVLRNDVIRRWLLKLA